MPKNPSEVARLYDELNYWQSIITDPHQSKSTKAAALAEVRKLERQLGIESKNYNGK